MEASTITLQDFASLIIVYGFAGFIGLPIGWLLGEGVILIFKKVKEHWQKKKEQKTKVDAVIE